MAATRTTKKPATKAAAKTSSKSSPARMSLAETMRALEKAGNAQARKTYARHGAEEPMFGVRIGSLKTLVDKIGVDHELALALWETGNHDARILAMKIADPAKLTPADLDRWAAGQRMRMCNGYMTALAAEGPHGPTKAKEWLADSDAAMRALGWGLAGHLAQLNEGIRDDWFVKRLAFIEKKIHSAANWERDAMNMAVISIGGRNDVLCKAALAAAKRIGKVEVDHGDTSCKTPDAGPYIEKMWERSAAKKFASPAAQERARESMRTRC